MMTSLFLLQSLPNLFGNSMCGDEGLELTDGYFYWGGDLLTHSRHPPLAKGLQALGARLEGGVVRWPETPLDPEQRAFNFLNVCNQPSVWGWLCQARMVTLLFGLLLGAGIAWGVRTRPKIEQWAALTLWAFEPTILGFSVVAQADIPLATFFLATILFWREGRGRAWGSWAVGLGAGMASCVKFSGLALFPILIFLQWYYEGRRKPLRQWVWLAQMMMGSALAVGVIYSLGTWRMPGHPLPWTLFYSGLMDLLNYHNHPTFFLGLLSRQNHLLYFPVTWFLKTGLAFTVMTLWGLMLVLKAKIPMWKWLPPLAFVVVHLPVQNLGFRYLLPCTPFLIWIAAEGVGKLWDGVGRIPRRSTRALAIALLLGQVASTVLSFPNHIGYFNDLVPKSAKKYLLADSNLDIGQDTGRMIRKLDELGLCKTKIAYFGGFPPVVCGNVCKRWRVQDAQRPEEGWSYALGVEYEQLGPAYDPDASAITNGWVRNISPDIRVGETWRIWINPASKRPKNQLMKK